VARKIEDLYDPPAPIEIVFYGGPHDGQRITMPWGGVPTSVVELTGDDTPVPNPFDVFEAVRGQHPNCRCTVPGALPPPPVPALKVAYRWNGRILDDGARVYQVIP
jgi:hypothetical protein